MISIQNIEITSEYIKIPSISRFHGQKLIGAFFSIGLSGSIFYLIFFIYLLLPPLEFQYDKRTFFLSISFYISLILLAMFAFSILNSFLKVFYNPIAYWRGADFLVDKIVVYDSFLHSIWKINPEEISSVKLFYKCKSVEKEYYCHLYLKIELKSKRILDFDRIFFSKYWPLKDSAQMEITPIYNALNRYFLQFPHILVKTEKIRNKMDFLIWILFICMFGSVILGMIF